MGFVKVVKNKAYFKRFQVKYRRRREGKTDYRARKRLITQDKNKYASPKYRLVVRFTNKDIVAQIVYSKITGDVVMSAAYSHELPRYGIKLGLTNYAAAYAVGLLLARRHLTNLGLADKYVGNTEASGSDYNVEEKDEGPRPFTALLDVGLVRTTTGHRIFGALKGALDGGLSVPHSERRFAGYNQEEKKLNPDVLRKYIFGGHVADYFKHLQSEDKAKFERHFSRFIKAGIKASDFEGIYKKAHTAIRQNPAIVKTQKKTEPKLKKYNKAKLSNAQRKNRVHQKKQAAKAAQTKAQ